jgi:endo-1,4-beta-xylanase
LWILRSRRPELQIPMRSCTLMITSKHQPPLLERSSTDRYSLDDPNYAKTKAMASRVRQWKAREVPIDGIGSQSHLKPGQAAKVYAALSMLCAEVSECAITELDIEGSNANEFATVSRACLDVRNCVGITMWGVRDSDSWRKERRPLLFDDSYNPKPGYMAILNGIGGR